MISSLSDYAGQDPPEHSGKRDGFSVMSSNPGEAPSPIKLLFVRSIRREELCKSENPQTPQFCSLS